MRVSKQQTLTLHLGAEIFPNVTPVLVGFLLGFFRLVLKMTGQLWHGGEGYRTFPAIAPVTILSHPA